MAHCFLFLSGLVILWIGMKTTDDEIHRLALTSAVALPLGWGYFSSPLWFQCLSGILIMGAYRN